MNVSLEPVADRVDIPATPGLVRRQVMAFLTAIRFLTRLPVPGLSAGGDEQVVYFPLVGALVGAATAGVIAGAEQLWATWLAVLLGLAFEALLTGALHEDAVADFCDAFGGGWTREDVLRILADSRVGSFGVLGLAFALLLRASAIAEVESSTRFVVIVASTTLGRWLMVVIMAWLPPIANRTSLSRDIAARVGLRRCMAATLLAVPGVAILGLTMPVHLAVALGALIIAGLLFTCYVRWRIGGVTGDCLGFACYLGQVLVLLISAARV